MSRPLPLCAVQTDPALGRAGENAAAVAEEVRRAAAEGALLVVLPEAALTGYLFESREEAERAAVRADGPELERVAAACRETAVWAVCGAIERADGSAGEPLLYNSAFLLGPEGIVGRYRKVHTLHLGADRFARPGDGAFRVFDLPVGRIGLHICYDGSFPESARVLRLLGARLLVLPTNWPSLALREAFVRVRAAENHAFFLAVNRVGTERGVRFEGGSLLADPEGDLLLHADDRPGRHHAEVDLERAREGRVVVRPGWYEYDRVADRRPERYAPLVEPVPDGPRTGSRG